MRRLKDRETETKKKEMEKEKCNIGKTQIIKRDVNIFWEYFKQIKKKWGDL